jgi:hypothetical protein
VVERCVHLDVLWTFRSQATRALVQKLNQSITLYPNDEWDDDADASP